MPQGWFHSVPQNVWPWLFASVGAIALVAIGLCVGMMLRQRDPRSRDPGSLSPSRQRALERDMANLINELAGMAREVGSQIDARAERLEDLIRDADERLAALEQARNSPSVNGTVEGTVIDPVSRVIESADPMSPSPLPAHPALSPVEGPDPRHVEIYTLADQGLAMQDIARRLRRPNGEVELILALRPKPTRASQRSA